MTTPALINDLDLVVTSPSGVRAYPWTLDPAAPANAAVRVQVDSLNNLEQVYVESPEVGTWQVQVVATAVPDGPQDFSVCTTPSPRVVDFMLSERFPDRVSPEPRDFMVTVRALGESLVGTPEMHYRFDRGDYLTVPMTLLGTQLYTASLPAPFCGETPEIYFTAQGSTSGLRSEPLGGASSPYAPVVAFPSDTFYANFEQNTGWTAGVAGDTATSGSWEWVSPLGTSAQPGTDTTPFGSRCYVTGQTPVGGFVGEADVDGGITTLVSPTFDLGGQDGEISYWRWFHNSLSNATPLDDSLVVEITNDGGNSWIELERVGPTSGQHQGGWFQSFFTVSDFVTPTANMQLRFIAQDIGNPHIVEAAVDDVRVRQLACPCSTLFYMRADVNDDDAVNIIDATSLFALPVRQRPATGGSRRRRCRRQWKCHDRRCLLHSGLLVFPRSTPATPVSRTWVQLRSRTSALTMACAPTRIGQPPQPESRHSSTRTFQRGR